MFGMLVSEVGMGMWNQLSTELAQAIQNVGKNIVTVQARGGRTSSGICWDADTLVTAGHAVSKEEDIRAWMAPDQPFAVRLIGRDFGSDIAVLKADTKIKGPGSTFVESPQLAVGQLVVAVARTRRGNLVTSAGLLSGLMGEWHTYRGSKIESFIRPDLRLYPGFSGGALVGADGKIIGMTTSALGRGSPLAVPYATLKRITSVLLEKGYIPRPYLGLGLQPVGLPESLCQKLNLTQQTGALVVYVEAGGPADRAGVLLGDVLLTVADHHFEKEGLSTILARLAPGQDANIGGIRGGQQFSSTVGIGERPRRQG